MEAALGDALRTYAAGDWFAAHEALEALWLQATAPARSALHGLLQVAVALHHAQQGNGHGTRALLARALGHLAAAPDTWNGLDLLRFRTEVAAFQDAVAAAAPEELPHLAATRAPRSPAATSSR